MSKKIDLSDIDLRKLDLTRKYDDDFDSTDGLAWRDHLLLYVIAAFVVVFIIWANVTKLDEVARGTAQIVPSSDVQVIQTLEGGIVEEFMVDEGDIVEAGQVLLKLRDVQARSDFQSNTTKYLGTLATVQRLKAEAEGLSEIPFTQDVLEGVPESVKAERNAFDANKRQYDNQLSVLEEQLSQKKQEVTELERRISDLARVIKLAQDEKDMIAPMVEKGAAPRIELLQLERQIAERQSELNGLRLALPRSKSAVQEAEQRINEHKSSFQAEAQRKLSEKTTEMNALQETLVAFADRSRRTEIKSPVRGTVKSIKINTVGGVAKPGEPIMEIVPLEDQMVVEAKIRPADIAFIYPGQKAVVRITAYDFSIYGSMEGEVVMVSPDATMNEEGESFYKVQVRTKQTQLEKGGKTYEIIPGMQATVDILTGEKTVMNYLLKPFIKASATAMRER